MSTGLLIVTCIAVALAGLLIHSWFWQAKMQRRLRDREPLK